ncbi:hypothetical protein ABIB77_007398, partial [Bradyrhizobium sp. i1.14.1]
AFLEPPQSPSRKRTFADSRPDAPQHCEKSGLNASLTFVFDRAPIIL